MPVASPETYLADLNPAQRDAVVTTEGPLLVVAGAGSGKTRVLTHRVAHLLAAAGAKPNEILAITFTNKAAQEMRGRIESMLGPVARAIWILTFHAACGRILRREAPRLGYRSNFTIYDQADQVRLVKQCLEDLEKDPKRFVPRGIHAVISSQKNQLVSPDASGEQVTVRAELTAFAARNGIPVLDLTDTLGDFRDPRARVMRLREDPHPSTVGHQAIADALLGALQSTGLVGG